MNISCLFAGLLTIASLTMASFLPPPTERDVQEQDRVIEIKSNSVQANEPVALTVIKTKKGVVKAGEKFQDDDDWLRGLTVRVENVSQKKITYLEVRFSFVRPENHETSDAPPLVHSLSYGVRDPAGESMPRSGTVATLMPGEAVDISLPSATYDAVKRALIKVKYPSSVKCVQIYLA